MERNESEKQLVSTLGQVVRWRKSNNQGIIEKNVKALHLIGEIVQSTPDTKAKAEGIKQLRLISKNHSEEMIKGEAESVLRGVKEFKAKSNIERLSLLNATIKSFNSQGSKTIFEDWVKNHAMPNMKNIVRESIENNDYNTFRAGMRYFKGIEKNHPSEKVRKLAGIASLNLKIQRSYEKNLRKG